VHVSSLRPQLSVLSVLLQSPWRAFHVGGRFYFGSPNEVIDCVVAPRRSPVLSECVGLPVAEGPWSPPARFCRRAEPFPGHPPFLDHPRLFPPVLETHFVQTPAFCPLEPPAALRTVTVPVLLCFFFLRPIRTVPFPIARYLVPSASFNFLLFPPPAFRWGSSGANSRLQYSGLGGLFADKLP